MVSSVPEMASVAKQQADAASRAALSGLKPASVAGTPSAPWNTEDISMAVRDIYDMSERTLINFIALGALARAIRDHKDSFMADHLEFGFFERNHTVEIKTLFKEWGFTKTKYGYTYFFTPPIKWEIKIPVEVHIFQKEYPFLANPDVGWFGVDDFNIPNPFEEYWKVRARI
jgi:hypothetical protein